MKIKTELSLVFLLCGIVPVILCAGVNYYSASSSSADMVKISRKHLEEQANTSLARVQQQKSEAIIDLMQLVNDQVITFSQRLDVIEACEIFSKEFGNGDFQKNVKPDEMAKVDKHLREFYTKTFGAKFKAENPGQEYNPDALISKLGVQDRLMQYDYIISNPNPLGEKDKLMTPNYKTAYNENHAKYHPAFRQFLNRFGYYDVFICDVEGRVVYSVFKELDYGTSLKTGPYADSNLAEVFRKSMVLPKGKAISVDFRPYYPSYNSPAGFTGTPIYRGDKLIGTAIFQLSLQRINDIMVKRAGLGETGESYLVGPDMIVRSDCFRDSDNRSLQNAFRNPEKAKINTASMDEILRGKSGFLADTKNYLGEQVMSSYAPLSIAGLKWGIITDISKAEALKPAEDISTKAEEANFWFLAMSAGGLILSALVIVFASNILGSRFSAPIKQAVSVLDKVANGDLTKRLPENQNNEFGQMAASLNQACTRIGNTIGTISDSTDTLNSASVHLSTNSESLSSDVSQSRTQTKHVSDAVKELTHDIRSMTENSEQMSCNMRSVATGVEQMTQTISEIAGNAEQSASVAQEAAQLASVSKSQISDLGGAADEIGKVIEVIQDIAEQTNLLALNATIEAARAGEAGKGFAVVATEVKELAKQTGAATDDIRSRIEGIQDSSAKAVNSIREISEVVEKVNLVATTIASAVEEQNLTTKEMARHIKETAEAAEDVSSAVARTGNVAEEITTTIHNVDQVIGRTVQAADDSLQQGNDLLSMASDMKGMVKQFKISGNSQQYQEA